MIKAVADTHAVIWYLFQDKRLSAIAQATIDQIASVGDQAAFSTITLAEILYLSERRRIAADTFSRLLSAITTQQAVLIDVPFHRDIALAMQQIDPAQVPELPDRMIAATALYLSVPVITRDHKIQASKIPTIW